MMLQDYIVSKSFKYIRAGKRYYPPTTGHYKYVPFCISPVTYMYSWVVYIITQLFAAELQMQIFASP